MTIISRLTAVIGGGLTVCVFVVVMVSRMIGTAQLPVLDYQGFLPDDQLPAKASCDPQLSEYMLCGLTRENNEIHFAVNRFTGIIHHTTIYPRHLTVAELLVVWGVPTGFERSGMDITVSWGSRFAVIHTCSFQPDNPVMYIRYDPDFIERRWLDRWRGFTGAAENISPSCQ